MTHLADENVRRWLEEVSGYPTMPPLPDADHKWELWSVTYDGAWYHSVLNDDGSVTHTLVTDEDEIAMLNASLAASSEDFS